MIKIREIDHIVLRVVDADRMIRFYTEILGCTIERRQDEIGLIQLRAGSSLVDLVPIDKKLGKMGGAAPPILPSFLSTGTRSTSELPARSWIRPISSWRRSMVQPRTSV